MDLKSRGVSLGLERMSRLMARLGHPERNVPCIHVAGTNGKGSVVAMLAAIFRTAGWRTGMYTSPHLVRLGERVQVNGENLSETAIVDYVRELEPVVAAMEAEEAGGVASYFEVMTAMALLHFSRARCDIACIEVGLGGRLDATNVIMPEVSVITSIGLDHVEFLGGTLAAIAAEKGGIIKSGRPVVIGPLPREAEEVIRGIAAQREARVYSVAEEFGETREDHPVTNLEGAYQRANAATATLVAKVMAPQWRLSDDIVARALLAVDWPARWQRFAVDGRILVLDASHNAQGAQALDANLSSIAREFGRPPIVALGVLGLSRAQPLVEVVCRHVREIHFVEPAQRRACSYEQLESLVPATYHGLIVRQSVGEIFPQPATCVIGQPGDVVVVTGSITLAGEVLSRIDPDRGAYEGHLQDF
ncbi:MAG TPA: folylpolyglutamate synthase/dihydrofolate synthase family protein [Opitutus sp.]|nr:folylpolyglutamate synthase/dihydrofolate synthase family protein [Opitutus sp.]